MIVRAPRPESKFYILDKHISEDTRLGWSARGMLIYLLGKPDHWQVSIANLINQTKEAYRYSGRDAVYRVLRELEAAGYLTRINKRADGGEFTGAEYVVSETPRHTAKPDAVKPDTPEPTQARTDSEQTNDLERKRAPRMRRGRTAKGETIYAKSTDRLHQPETSVYTGTPAEKLPDFLRPVSRREASVSD